MERSIEPMPVAKMLEPPKPLTGRGGIAVQVRKSEHSGEMWTVAPVSKMKGDLSTLTGTVRPAAYAEGESEGCRRSTGRECDVQLREALGSSWTSSMAANA